MANNPILDVTMLFAAQQVYNVTDAGVFSGTLPAGYVVDDLLIPDDRVDPNGLKLIAFKNDATGERIIAFSGTEFSSKDLYTDAQLGVNQWQSAERIIRNYISQVMADVPGATFHFTGHSLGGGLAEYAAYFAKTDPTIAQLDPTITLTTFNAMGTLDSLATRQGTTKDAINAAMADTYIAHYVAKGDLVGLLGGGHVGEVVNGQINTYTAGTNTRFFLTAHDKFNPDFQSLAYAQQHDYRSEYLTLQYTQGVLAQIASLGDGNGLVSSPSAILRLFWGLIATVQAGDRQELDQLGDWLAQNAYDAGLIDANTYTAAIQIDWGVAGNIGNLASIGGAIVVVGVTGQVTDVLDTLSQWAGGAADALINSVRADTKRYTDTVTTALGNAAGREAATDLSTWQDNGYDFTSVLTQAQNTATLVVNNPGALEAQIDANPLSFLPTLTAPDPNDYADDPAGQSAYNQALTLYTQKQDERTQVQTLYNQYAAETNALTLFTVPSYYRDPSLWQTTISGDTNGVANDDIHADPITTALYGLAGHDILSGRTGEDGSVQGIQLYGGMDYDILYGEVLYTGQYYTLGSTEFETQYGRVKPGQGAFLYGEAGQDVLLGSLKDDTLDGGEDSDYLHGYLGHDTLIGGAGNDIENGNEGQDDIQGDDGIDRLGGGAGADYLQGGAQADTLYGDSSWLQPSPSPWDGINYTLLEGTLVGDIRSIPIVRDVLETDAGDDVLEGGANDDRLFGGAGDDLLDGGLDADELQGEGGDDILFGSDGNDKLWGDSSADAVTDDAQIVLIAGNYTYYYRQRYTGPDGNDYLDGGTGNDQLWGGGGQDHLVGGTGSDYLHGGLSDGSISGDDILEGGDDNDFLYGEDGTDTLRGDAGLDELHGGDNNDGLFGGAENDKLWGDAGADVLHGEAGDDFLYGGDGEDTLFGGDGVDQLTGDAGRDVIYAGDGNDIIAGDSEDDLIFGELGNDAIDGGAGNDEIYGGAGANSLSGGSGNDILVGSGDADVLNGGPGNDTIDSGGGNDTFVLDNVDADTYLNTGGDNTYRIALGPDTPDIGPLDFTINIQDTGGLDTLRLEQVFLGPNPFGGSLYITPQLTGLTRQGNDLLLDVWLRSDITNAPDLRGQVHLIDHFTLGEIELIDISGATLTSERGARDNPGVYYDTAYAELPWSTSPAYGTNNPVRQTLISGGAGDDTLTAVNTWTTHFYGNAGNDVMIGGSAPDYFHGGAGADRLEGKTGNDTYYIDPTDADVIFDDGRGTGSDSAFDIAVLETPQALADLVFTQQDYDLLIGNVRLERYFEPDTTQTAAQQTPYAIETLQGNGWTENLLDYVQGRGMRFLVRDTANVGVLFGSDYGDYLQGLEGTDILYGNAGSDRLDGGTNDGLGNAGMDILEGGDGGDIYDIYRGGGFDYIDENYWTGDAWTTARPGQTDVIEFGAGITPENIRVEWNSGIWFTYPGAVEPELSSGSLGIDLGNGEGLALEDKAGGSAFGIERFRFSDGRELTLSEIQALDQSSAGIGTQAGTSGNDILHGSFWQDQLFGYEGNDLLIGEAWGDVLDGGAGADILIGGSSREMSEDLLYGGAGADTYLFNAGDGQATSADYIYDLPGATGETDTLSLGNGIRPEDVLAYLGLAENADGTGYSTLFLRLAGTGEHIAAIDWLSTYDSGAGLTTYDLRIERLQFLGPEGNFVFDLTGLVDARLADLRMASVLNPWSNIIPLSYYIPLFRAADLTAFDISPTADIAGGQYALNYALNGDVFDPVIVGTSGNDPVLNGTDGPDKIYGFTGNDVLDGGLSDDQLFGGTGDDTYQARLGDGYDLITDTGGNDRMVFGPGINPSDIQVTLNVWDPVYYDYLYLSASTIVSGNISDYDTVITNWSIGNTLHPFVGNEIETFIFDSGLQMTAQEIIVQPQWTYFDPDLGGYVTTGRTLSGYIYSTTGSSDGSISGTEENDILKGSATAINGYGGNDSLFGDVGNDTLMGGSGSDKLAGDYGDDLLDGGTGTDAMYGGQGNDTYMVDDIGDTVTELFNEGTDIVQSSITYTLGTNLENLTLTGTATINGTGNELANVVTGNDNSNWLYGKNGNDILYAGGGADWLYGGAGNDVLNGGTASSGVWNGSWLYGEDGDDTLMAGGKSINYLDGGNGNDSLTVTGGSYTTMNGGAGNDLLTAAGGTDYLNGGLGADAMTGGAGNDTYVVDNTGDTVTENLNEGTDTVLSSGTYVLTANVENLTLTGTTAINGTGNALNNVITGNNAGNWLRGGAGNDTLYALGGADWLYGGVGNDTLMGGAPAGGYFNGDWLYGEGGDDRLTGGTKAINYLHGGAGNDTLTVTGGAYNTLIGDTGNDTLAGAGGADYLDGGAGSDTLNGGGGNDIYRFSTGYGQDTITDNDNTAGNTDTVSAGINPLDLIFSQSGPNLLMSVHGATDSLNIGSWYSGAANQTEVFKASDNSTLANTQVDQLIQAMAQFSANNGGVTWDQAIDQNPTEVQAVLAAYWQLGAGG